MPICKRPCSDCPFRKDGASIELRPGRLEGIVSGLLADDRQTFVCLKTLPTERMTCAGVVGLMSKLGRLPVIARLGLAVGVITEQDIEASSAMVVDAHNMVLPKTGPKKKKGRIGMSVCPNAWVAEDPSQPGTAFAVFDADLKYEQDAAVKIAVWQDRYGVKARLVNKEYAKRMLDAWDRKRFSLSPLSDKAGAHFETECMCGQKFLIAKAFGRRTSRADGKRFFYLNEEETGLSAFSCRSCHKPVNETVPGAEYCKTLPTT